MGLLDIPDVKTLSAQWRLQNLEKADPKDREKHVGDCMRRSGSRIDPERLTNQVPLTHQRPKSYTILAVS
jgi:hypothetical protein